MLDVILYQDLRRPYESENMIESANHGNDLFVDENLLSIHLFKYCEPQKGQMSIQRQSPVFNVSDAFGLSHLVGILVKIVHRRVASVSDPLKI